MLFSCQMSTSTQQPARPTLTRPCNPPPPPPHTHTHNNDKQQGVGKNKLVDRLLELLGAEREYVQLHRDTTLGSLTAVPTLVDGRIVYEDSPLVRAVRHGRVLVVDEADKAPVEVVMVLKGLLEDGFLLLGDGRRVVGRAVDESGGGKGGGGRRRAHPPGVSDDCLGEPPR